MAKQKKPTLGELIDSAYAAREARLARQHEHEQEIAVLKEREEMIEQQIIDGFSAAEVEAARGKYATAAIKSTMTTKVKDMPMLWAWARDNDAMDLFHKRVNSLAYAERSEAGEKIPGVEVGFVKSLSLTATRK